jgi:stage II sporulation protein D
VPASPRAREVLAGAPRAPFVDDDFKIRVGRALGFNVVPSNTIDRLERRGSHYVISGRGFGHRVGLCQAGARHLARSGRSAAQILARYFPAAVVSTRTTDQDVSREADRTTSER